MKTVLSKKKMLILVGIVLFLCIFTAGCCWPFEDKSTCVTHKKECVSYGLGSEWTCKLCKFIGGKLDSCQEEEHTKYCYEKNWFGDVDTCYQLDYKPSQKVTPSPTPTKNVPQVVYNSGPSGNPACPSC